jgi:peptidoglycan/xylan/chitin deacetylase (PgdA/CDA1 family)
MNGHGGRSDPAVLKTNIKRALRTGTRLMGARGVGSGRVVVLCYHSIHPSNPFRSATPELFVEHLAWLKEHCDVIPFTQVLPATITRSPRPSVAITFDDGHEDNHRFAFPSLKAHGLTATFFLTAGLMEKDPDVVHRFELIRQCDYEAIRPMEWSQVQEMVHEAMDVGAHSYSHRNFARLRRAELEHELTDARQIIEERLDIEVTSLAYPFGKPRIHVTDSVMEMARAAGYSRATATVKRGVRTTDPALRIPRMFVTQDSVEELRDKVLGQWDALGVMQEHSPLWLSKLLSPTDFAY